MSKLPTVKVKGQCGLEDIVMKRLPGINQSKHINNK